MSPLLIELIGYCGLYCGACEVYRQVHDQPGNYLPEVAARLAYGGCRGCGSTQHSSWCKDCDLRACASERGARHCADCAEFPCSRISEFDQDGVPHHTGVLDSLKRLRQVRQEQWLQEKQQVRACQACGALQHHYSNRCPSCGQPFVGLERK